MLNPSIDSVLRERLDNSQCLVNEKKIDETYVRYQSGWNLSSRKVDNSHVYVVGDNRSVPIGVHQF